MSRVVVTGGAGKAGRAVVRDLLEHGYDVVSVDMLRDPNLAEGLAAGRRPHRLRPDGRRAQGR
jgi:nucleoside-diphosphate-sugar epimerase